MKHNCKVVGYGYQLRPAKLEDAQFILEVRREDEERNRFIHKISEDVSDQIKWLEAYFERDKDYYLVIENRYTGQAEGLIGVYNFDGNIAEWGRWIIKKGSLAATESVYLIYKLAFEQLGLEGLYCNTLELNEPVVSFHDSIGEIRREDQYEEIEWDGVQTRFIKHTSDRDNFYNNMAPRLKKNSVRIAARQRKQLGIEMEFHHIGVATKSIEKELPQYTVIGYEEEGDYFEDPGQGIRGLFVTAKGYPRLELLENLEGSTTLDIPLKNNQKMYHRAYYVDNIDNAIAFLKSTGAKIMVEKRISTYFGKNICFIMLRNMELVELLER